MLKHKSDDKFYFFIKNVLWFFFFPHSEQAEVFSSALWTAACKKKKKRFYIPNKHKSTQLIHNSIVKFMSHLDKMLTVNNTQAKKNV